MPPTRSPAFGCQGPTPQVVEVFADIACPFTHVSLQRFQLYRRRRGSRVPILRVRAWPLELVNGTPLDGPSLIPKVLALRASVAPHLFAGFTPARFPTTTLPAMVAEAAAYRRGLKVGEEFGLAVRHALFERGLDVSDGDVLRDLRTSHRVPTPSDDDRSAVLEDFADGVRRGVAGSPHFFTSNGDFFCPSLDISQSGDRYDVEFDPVGFERLLAAAST